MSAVRLTPTVGDGAGSSEVRPASRARPRGRSRARRSRSGATVMAAATTSAAPPTISGKVKKNGLVHAAGQGDEQGRDGDRHRALDDELGRAQGVRRQQVVDDEHEQRRPGRAGRGSPLRLGPQPGAADDGRRGQDEHPADDADDAVVGVGRRRRRRVDRRGRRSRRPRPSDGPGGRRRRRSVGTLARVAQQRDQDARRATAGCR